MFYIKTLIFQLKHNGIIQNCNISCKIYVNVFQLIQNVNISFEICVNVFQLIQNVNIPLEICVTGSVDMESCAYVYGWPSFASLRSACISACTSNLFPVD